MSAVSLPEIDSFRDVPAQAWRAFAQRVASTGLTEEWAAPWLDVAAGVYDPLRRPVERWNARFAEGPAGTALRLLFTHDTIPGGEAEAALGAENIGNMCAAGVLRRQPDGLRCAFEFLFLDGALLLCDDLTLGGEAVMGASVGTRMLSRAALPPGVVGRVADLGCGAGALAVALTPWANEVFASDINPRAFAFLEANAAMNGLESPRPLRGSLWEAYRGERFDWVVSQPPFLPTPVGAPGSTFLFGGRRGDELPLELLAGLDKHLAPDGCAVIRVDWPLGDMPSIDERVEAALGSHWGVLLLHGPAVDADALAVTYADVQSRGAGVPFEELCFAWRQHLRDEGIIAALPTVAVLRRAEQSWCESLHLGEAFNEMSSPPVHELYRSMASLHTSEERLLTARLELPIGAVRVTERSVVDDSERELLRFSAESLAPEVELESGDWEVLIGATAADSLGEWLGNDAPEGALEAVRELIGLGILRVAGE